MLQTIDWSGFHIKTGETVSIVVPCLEFVLFLDTTDDAGILDFYNRARSALGSRITYYQAESMTGFKKLNERGVGFKSLQENIDTTTSGGKLIFHIFSALAEFERDLI